MTASDKRVNSVWLVNDSDEPYWSLRIAVLVESTFQLCC